MSETEFTEFQNKQNSENSSILKMLMLTKKKTKKLTIHRLGRVACGEKPKERNTKRGGNKNNTKTIPMYHHHAIIFCIALAVFYVACNPDKKDPLDNCDTYRLRYITDVRYDGGQAFTNRFSIGYEDDGKLITRYTIFNADTFPSDYVKLNSNGQAIEYGNVPHPSSPTIRNDYFYQSDRVAERQYWSSVSPGAPIMLAQTSNFSYTNGLLSKVEYFEPNNPAPGAQMEVIYETDPKAKTYFYIALPSQQIIQEDRYHFTNLLNPLAALEIGAAWGIHEFLPDTVSFRLIDGTYKSQFFEYETEDNRVLRAKTYQVGSTAELKRDVVYEYECY